jgi:hypothetical protein
MACRLVTDLRRRRCGDSGDPWWRNGCGAVRAAPLVINVAAKNDGFTEEHTNKCTCLFARSLTQVRWISDDVQAAPLAFVCVNVCVCVCARARVPIRMRSVAGRVGHIRHLSELRAFFIVEQNMEVSSASSSQFLCTQRI